MPTAIRLLLKQSVINNGIPFPLKGDPFNSQSNQEHLALVTKDLREGKNSAVHEMLEE